MTSLFFPALHVSWNFVVEAMSMCCMYQFMLSSTFIERIRWTKYLHRKHSVSWFVHSTPLTGHHSCSAFLECLCCSVCVMPWWNGLVLYASLHLMRNKKQIEHLRATILIILSTFCALALQFWIFLFFFWCHTIENFCLPSLTLRSYNACYGADTQEKCAVWKISDCNLQTATARLCAQDHRKTIRALNILTRKIWPEWTRRPKSGRRETGWIRNIGRRDATW